MRRISELSRSEQEALLHFNFTGGPVEDPTACEHPFAAFGFAAMAWGRLETHLDALLIHINKRSFSVELFDMDHPRSFSRKLRLLKKWFRKHKALVNYVPAIDKLVSQLKKLSELRNSYFHALFSDYNSDKDEITLRGLEFVGDDKFHSTRTDLGTQKLIQFGLT